MSRLQLDAATWSQLNRLLDEALDKTPADRAAWLESLGPELDALKPQLRELLQRAAAVETGDFLNTLPKFHAADTEAGANARVGRPGETVGLYRLVRELGVGGMGTVWFAERIDGLINRPVALKLPHLVAAQRADLAERMAREREILATLDHRNIARLLDAGVTTDGQPFLALEYIEGISIDRFCSGVEGSAALDIRARLKLFRQVADAVAYAHGKLALHRDLKPANILVTAGGGVKLLDFGIAKLLADGKTTETRLTEIGGRALTPDYASPEQILGEPLTVASDVYSLGVVLFELLTGARPYRPRRDSRGALEDAIVQEESPRASQMAPQALRGSLRGDLDTILAKALKKNPAERYPTANAFADDIARYLEQRPVLARPDSGWYRLRKFVARNRVAVAAAVAVVAAVLVATGVSIWQAVEAGAQRDAALRQQRRAEAYSDFMGVLLQDAGAGQGGKPLSTTELLDRGVLMLERQSGLDDNVTAHLWYELSRNYLLFVNAKRELELLDRAVAGAERIGDRELLAAAQCSASWNLMHLSGDASSATQRFERGGQALAAVARPSDYALLDCLRAEARLLEAQGKIDEAIAVVQEGRKRLAGVGGPDNWRSDVLRTQLSSLYRAGERFKEALAVSEESLRAVRDSGRTGSLAELVQLNNYSGNLCKLGEVLRCASIGEETLQWAARAESSQLPMVGLRANVGFTLLRLEQAERALALAEHDNALAREAGSLGAAAMSDLLASRALLALGRREEAEARIAVAELFWNKNPTAFRRMLLESGLQRGEIELASGDLAAAGKRAAGLLASLGYPQEKTQAGLDRMLRFAAQVSLAANDPAAALRYAEDFYLISTRIARERESSADVGMAALLLARARDALGQREEAIADLTLAISALGNGFGVEHSETRRARSMAQAWGVSGS